MEAETRIKIALLIEQIDHCQIAAINPDECRLCEKCEAALARIKELIEDDDV